MTQSEILDLSEQLNEEVVLAMNALSEGSDSVHVGNNDDDEDDDDGDEGDQ